MFGISTVVHDAIQALKQCHSRVMALIQGEDSLMPHLLVELIETCPHKFPRPAGSSNELRQDALDVLWVNALIDFVPRLSAGKSGTLTHVDPHVKRLLQTYARKLPALSFVSIWYLCQRSVICGDGWAHRAQSVVLCHVRNACRGVIGAMPSLVSILPLRHPYDFLGCQTPDAGRGRVALHCPDPWLCMTRVSLTLTLHGTRRHQVGPWAQPTR